jgi:hypothetical protein
VNDTKPYWERYTRVAGHCGEWFVKFDGKTIASFLGEEAEHNAETFHDWIIDPRSTAYTDGFIEGMECWERDADELRAALMWLCREQGRLTGEASIAGDIYREACAEGRRIVEERRHR